jgi:hypothetical protein
MKEVRTMGTHTSEFRPRFFHVFGRIALLAAILTAGGSATASILLLPSPEADQWSDIAVPSVIGMYSGGMFVVMGIASSFDVGPGEFSDFGPFVAPMTIGAMIDSSGNVASGNLNIHLMGPSLGPPGSYPAGSDLLNGTITHAQFEKPGVLQLQFTVNSGSAAGDFGGVGAFGGIIINMVSGDVNGRPFGDPTNPDNGPPPSSFSAPFEITGGSADVIGGAIPEPSAWMVWTAIVSCVLLAKRVCRAHNNFADLCS